MGKVAKDSPVEKSTNGKSKAMAGTAAAQQASHRHVGSVPPQRTAAARAMEPTSGGQVNISGLSLVDAWLALTSTPNLYVMTNGEYRQDFIERLATELDPTRVLFASFAPVFDAAFEVARIRSARLTGDARILIEHENAQRLFLA